MCSEKCPLIFLGHKQTCEVFGSFKKCAPGLDPGLFHHVVAYYQRNRTKCWEREGEGERKGSESGR